ncbi:MAG: DNA repair exonuclease [Nitrospirae bacterium]|nr:DNA repair exonuclease [Nitrospirota bacterium]MCL5284388.1 DNA repair exonuclease [Nitrospirota bacterium]
MKFFHAADIHLDSPLRSLALEDQDQLARIRRATREAFSALVDRAIEEKVSLLLLAGDLYDHDNPNMQVVHFLRRELSRLADHGIRVVIVRGNHDAANRISRHLDLPANTTVFSDRAPETMVLEEHGVAVTGQSFAPGPVTQNLALAYPPPRPGLFNIALLHTSLAGSPDHDSYAPCTLPDLVARGYDYWALGHIHRREILSRDPAVVFPGNLQGRHAKETGPKGAMLAETDGARLTALDFVPLDVVRWHLLPLDLSGLVQPRELGDPLRRGLESALRESDGRPAAVRVILTGRSSLPGAFLDSPEQVRQLVLEVAAEVALEDLWIERVRFDFRREAIREVAGPDDDFAAVLSEVARDREALAAALADDLSPFRRALPEELREELDASPVLADPASLLPVLSDLLYRGEAL